MVAGANCRWNRSNSTIPLDGGEVQGRYELPSPTRPTTVAVKIVDMLGEEVLATATV